MSQQPKRIVIIGPESTGKSTLTRQLAAYFHTSYAGEYARQYLENLSRPYVEEDLLLMARGQTELEDLAAQQAQNGLAFLDTDLQVIRVWSEDKYGTCAEAILRTIAARRYDLYILTGIDMPWQDDPLREHPQPEMRRYFYRIYADIVQQSGIPFLEVQGDENARLHAAVSYVERMLRQTS